MNEVTSREVPLAAPAAAGETVAADDAVLDPNRPLSREGYHRLIASGAKVFDAAEHLDTADGIAVFLDEYLLDNEDPRAFAQAIGVVARARGMTAIAREAGLSRESLYKALSGARSPDFDTVSKVLTALGLRLAVTGRAAAPIEEAA